MTTRITAHASARPARAASSIPGVVQVIVGLGGGSPGLREEDACLVDEPPRHLESHASGRDGVNAVAAHPLSFDERGDSLHLQPDPWGLGRDRIGVGGDRDPIDVRALIEAGRAAR